LKISDTPPKNPAGDVQQAMPTAPEPRGEEASPEPAALVAGNAMEAPESKILQLRKQYLDGTYKVDAKDLSEKIVDYHLRE
jgi:anti-sigma28 factor (negative regulator of flagellin synthesis)